MLINTMTALEINKEVRSDYEEIWNKRTIDRFVEAYEKQRRKFKIPKTEEYPIAKEFKSHKKNPWIIIMRKNELVDKYNKIGDTGFEMVTYYYTPIGLRVFNYKSDDSLAVYNGHVFTRYRMRMGLEIESIIDVVKHFFCKTGNMAFEFYHEKEKDPLFMGLTNEGYLFGSRKDDCNWMVVKTFVNKDTATLNQYLREQGLVDMRDFIEIQIKAKEDRTKFHQDMLQLFRQKFVSEDGKIVLKKDNDE